MLDRLTETLPMEAMHEISNFLFVYILTPMVTNKEILVDIKFKKNTPLLTMLESSKPSTDNDVAMSN